MIWINIFLFFKGKNKSWNCIISKRSSNQNLFKPYIYIYIYIILWYTHAWNGFTCRTWILFHFATILHVTFYVKDFCICSKQTKYNQLWMEFVSKSVRKTLVMCMPRKQTFSICIRLSVWCTKFSDKYVTLSLRIPRIE